MYIKNKKTGVVQECRNKDVIRVCRKDAETFEVFEKKPVPEEEKTEDNKENKILAEMSVTELKELAKEKGLTGYSGLNKEELIEILKDVVE